MITEHAERHPVDRLAEEFVARYRRGERPSISEYARLYPDLAGELEELLTALMLMEEHGPAAFESGTDRGGVAAESTIPDHLGEYRILREIGRGGMGVVYEAVQESLGRHVALKVLPAGALMDPTRLKRFQREGQAAARLHHTNIVPVFGVGEYGGVRFYAMQFIRAQSLDKVIDEVRQQKNLPALQSPQADSPGEGGPADNAQTASAGLSTQSDSPRYYRSVARLGEQIADALAHAHQQGILHRDIKPANLLLDAQGNVWVTDFGLATGDGMEELTQTGDVVGTLRYLAPERLQGQGDGRADVYSLGLTLYELLTLRPAFDDPDRAVLVRQIAEADPPRPRKLDPRIPRDLETIVLKACAREPSRRYATGGELADDLRRFLGDRSIEARRTPWWEQAWRWCRRNRGVSIGSATTLAALLIGLGMSLWQWQRADDSRRQAETSADQAEKDFELAFQAVDQMLERVGFEHLQDEPYMDPKRRALLQDAVSFYENLRRGREGDSRLRFAVARAHFRLGQIHGWFRDLENAQLHQDHAFALVSELLVEDQGHIDYRRLTANLYLHRAWLRRSSRQLSAAEADYRQAVAGFEQLSAERPDQPEFIHARAYALRWLGEHLHLMSRLSDADATLRQTIAVAEGLPSAEPRRCELLADAHESLSRVLESNGNLAERDERRGQALELFERCARDNPGPRQQHKLALQLAEIAGSLSGEPSTRTKAETMYARSVAISERLATDFPDAPHIREGLARTSNGFGLLLNALSRPREAEAAFERSAALWKELVVQFPEVPAHRVGHGVSLHNQALKRAARSENDSARALFEEAIGHQEAVLQSHLNEARALENLCKHYRELVRVLHRLEKVEDAEKLIQRQLASAQRWSAADSRSLPIRAFLARSYENAGRVRQRARRFPESGEAFREAAVHWRTLVAAVPARVEYASSLGVALNDRALALNQQGHVPEMIPLLDEAVELQERAVRDRPKEGHYQQYLCNHYSLRAEARVRMGDHASILATASVVRDRFPQQVSDLWWASLLARSIPLAEKDMHFEPDERARLAGTYAEEAMRFLERAQRKSSTDFSHPDFAPLRSRPDFQKRLGTVPKAVK